MAREFWIVPPAIPSLSAQEARAPTRRRDTKVSREYIPHSTPLLPRVAAVAAVVVMRVFLRPHREDRVDAAAAVVAVPRTVALAAVPPVAQALPVDMAAPATMRAAIRLPLAAVAAPYQTQAVAYP